MSIYDVKSSGIVEAPLSLSAWFPQQQIFQENLKFYKQHVYVVVQTWRKKKKYRFGIAMDF